MDLIVTSIFVVREIKIINKAIKTQAFEYSLEQAG
jgi:hypothetical protein